MKFIKLTLNQYPSVKEVIINTDSIDTISQDSDGLAEILYHSGASCMGKMHPQESYNRIIEMLNDVSY